MTKNELTLMIYMMLQQDEELEVLVNDNQDRIVVRHVNDAEDRLFGVSIKKL